MDGTYIVKCPWYRDYVYDNNTYVYDNITYMHWNIYYQYFIIYTRDQMQFTAYVLHLTTYGLRLTAYGSRLTDYGLRLCTFTDHWFTDYGLLPLPDFQWFTSDETYVVIWVTYIIMFRIV